MALLTEAEFNARLAALKARYPYQFDHDNIGHSVRPGWLNIAAQLFAGVDAVLSDAEKPRFGWFQIKEKLGGIRAYFDAPGFAEPTVQAILDLVEAAELASLKTCCFCSSPGKRREGSWILTLCDKCATRRREYADQERS